MNQTTIFTGIIALLVGLGGGYFLHGAVPNTVGTHVMPDGSGMSDQMHDMQAGLAGKTGDAFDKTFIEEMIVHHEGAVAMAQEALKSAKHSEIKEMAQNIISAQTSEIATMRGWLQSWYNN